MFIGTIAFKANSRKVDSGTHSQKPPDSVVLIDSTTNRTDEYIVLYFHAFNFMKQWITLLVIVLRFYILIKRLVYSQYFLA